MPKQIMFDENGRRLLREGIEKLTRVVSATFGPGGRNVALGKPSGKTSMSRDGVSVAKEIEIENPFENIGAKLLNEVANRTNKDAGDGTTTSVVLAEALISEGSRYMVAGVSPIALRNGMQLAAEKAIEALKKLARPADKRQVIEQVAYVASNRDEEIAKVMAEAMTRVGEKGVVTVDKGDGVTPVLEFVDGLEFDKGYISPYFITDSQLMIAKLENPRILITDHKLSGIRDLVPILEKMLVVRKPLLIVAEDVDGEALAGLIINRMRGVLEVAAIKAPAFGDRRKSLLEDLAIITGGAFLSKDLGFDWKTVDLEQLGRCGRVEIHKDKTVFFKGEGKPEAIATRKKQIQSQIEQTTSTYDREKLEERLGKLEGRIAVIKVGGYTETELNQRKERVEDALSATRAALEEGIVAGGGTAFLRAIPAVLGTKGSGDVRFGIEIVARALRKPLETIARNAGYEGPAIVEEVLELEGDTGFDATTGRTRDLVQAGVVDPVKVLRIALQNAVSIASLYLVSDTVISDLPKGKEAVAGAQT